ncbi:MAG TPA: UDP-N-acetylmuramoyl-L-alanine--D-glutamate ligase [Verrucomicrobiales bacterium]|nr:UDP-N-acetylmuramoyl-L-alanine--D-glutamate ligase [Verrucomicrobiales bacterium]
MYELSGKTVLVIGLGVSGRSAAALLLRRGARVCGVDAADTETLRKETGALVRDGATIRLGNLEHPETEFDLAVISPGVPPALPLVASLKARGVPLIGELELAYRLSACLHVAITGTNGKTTTTEMVESVLTQSGRQTVAAGNIGLPACDVVEQTRDLDFLTLEVSSFQLETIEYFRPTVAVLTNLTPDHFDRYASMAEYIRAKARLFMNQQLFDWAIVQSEALAQMRSLGLTIPSKTITYSANNRRADLFLDRGLIVSQMPDWTGPLLSMDQCRVAGPHNAENLMAALAVSRVLRLPLQPVIAALKKYSPAPHRCEPVAEIGGVRFINDSKATNLDATAQAIRSVAAAPAGEPNIWLIAGGKDKGFEYHDIGPLLSQRVKGAFLLGETRGKIRAAWSLFTPCQLVDSLPEAVRHAAEAARSGDVVLLSPACSSFDMFRNYQHRGDVFRQTVLELSQSPAANRPASSQAKSGQQQNN